MKYLRLLGRYACCLWLLSSCAVYNSVFHPHRLPTPPMSATAKAKAKAAEKARHKGLTLKTEEPITEDAPASPAPAAPADAPATPVDKPKTVSYNELPAGTKLTYDKHGLLKRDKLTRVAISRRQLHHYDTRPEKPREASRENRRLRKRGHTDSHRASPPQEAPNRPAPDEGMGPRVERAPAPQPDPTQPAAKPAKAEKPAKEKAEKLAKEKTEKPKADKKAKKAPVPKPDPTQPQPFKGDQ